MLRTKRLFVASILTVSAVGIGSFAASQRASADTCPAGGCSTTSAVAKETKNIVQTAIAAGQFNTLAAALKAAGLVDALQGEGPFTVFAPTDEAFAKLPAGTVETLLKPENRDKLTAILTYHVVSGKATSKDVAGLDSAKTLNGKSVSLKVNDGKVHVGAATVVAADVHASNGVIHVIDTVLIPQEN